MALSAMLSRRRPLMIALASTTAIVASFLSSTGASGAGAGAALAMAAQLAILRCWSGCCGAVLKQQMSLRLRRVLARREECGAEARRGAGE